MAKRHGHSITGSFKIVDLTISGDLSRIVIPTNPITGKALIFCHGLGQFVDDLKEFDPTSVTLNHFYYAKAIENRYLMAAGRFGGFNWNNATAQTAIENLVAYLVSNHGITQVVMFGGSAGGPIGLLKATQGFTGVTVKGWFNVFPVVNLDAAEHNANLKASVDAAFPSYPTDAAGRDPILFTASAFNGLRLRCCQSLTDATTPAATHGDALVTLASGHATEATCTHTSGDHGDPSNFTPALADDFISFLGRCFS